MKRPDPNHTGWSDLMIEAYLDDELDDADRARLEAAMAADHALLDELTLARSIRQTLRELPPEICPPDLVPAVVAVARREARTEIVGRVYSWFRHGFVADWRPFVAMATLIAVVVGAVLVDRSGRTAPGTDPAVAEALAQVKWTLAVVADVGRKTGRAVRDDVLEPHLIEPMNDALAHVFEPPQPTDKR